MRSSMKKGDERAHVRSEPWNCSTEPIVKSGRSCFFSATRSFEH